MFGCMGFIFLALLELACAGFTDKIEAAIKRQQAAENKTNGSAK